MSEVHVHRVQPAWKKNALIDNDTYLKWYADSIKNPDKFWGKHGKRIDWFKPFTKVKNTSFDGKVSIKWFEDGAHQCFLQLHRPASEEARRPDRHHLGRRQSLRRQEDHLQRALRACLPARQCDEEARRQEGRPRHHLHADDPGSGLCDAGLHAHRRHPFDRLRRLLAGCAGRPHRRLRIDLRHHRRRGPARRQADPAEGEHRQGDRHRRQAARDGQERARRAPHRRQDRLGARAATSGTTTRSRR